MNILHGLAWIFFFFTNYAFQQASFANMFNSYIYEGSLVSMNSNQHKHHHHGKLMQHYSLRLTRVHVPKNIKIFHRLHRRRKIFLCIKKKRNGQKQSKK